MSVHSARLLLADIPQGAKSDAKAPISPESPTAIYPVLPVADVLVTERRVCGACGNVSEAQSDRIHRLLHSCAEHPFKRILRPRKPDEVPLDLRVEHTIEVIVPHCACCWAPTAMWGEVRDVRPEPPKRVITYTAMGMAMEEAKRAKLKKPDLGKRLAAMPLDQALDFL